MVWLILYPFSQFTFCHLLFFSEQFWSIVLRKNDVEIFKISQPEFFMSTFSVFVFGWMGVLLHNVCFVATRWNLKSYLMLVVVFVDLFFETVFFPHKIFAIFSTLFFSSHFLFDSLPYNACVLLQVMRSCNSPLFQLSWSQSDPLKTIYNGFKNLEKVKWVKSIFSLKQFFGQ